MKKKILVIIFVVIAIIALCAVIFVGHKMFPNGSSELKAYDDYEQALDAASFGFEYPDRLCKMPDTQYNVNSSMIEVSYGEAGYVRKTLGVTDNSDPHDYSDETTQEINGMTVKFEGDGETFNIAVWNYNNYAYTVFVSEGVSADEMTEYVLATR